MGKPRHLPNVTWLTSREAYIGTCEVGLPLMLPVQGLAGGEGVGMRDQEVPTLAVSPQSPKLLPPLYGEAARRWAPGNPRGGEGPRLAGRPDHLSPAAAHEATRGAAEAAMSAGEAWDLVGSSCLPRG